MDSNYIILFIIGNNGSMIYCKNFDQSVNFTSNDCLQIAATLFTINDLSSLIIPEKVKKNEEIGFEKILNHQLEYIYCDNYYINCFNSLTNMKIILVTKNYNNDIKNILKTIYELYGRILTKDNSYSSGQPIKNKYFEDNINRIFNKKK